MPDVTGPPVTLDGTAIQGAAITVIHNDTGAVLGETTTDTSGNWVVSVSGGQTVHVLATYEDADGNLYRETSKPFVTVEPAFWSEALHRYQFTEGSGTTVADTGAASSLSDLTLHGPVWTTDAVHKDWAIDLDGTDDYGTASNRSTFSGFTEGMTFLCWAKVPQVDTRFTIATCYETATDDRAWNFEQNSLNELRVYYSDDGVNFKRDLYSNFTQYDQWIRLGFRWSSNANFEFLINGSVYAATTTDATVTSIYQSASPFEMGRATHATGRYFPGQLDDTMLWDRALTDTEVQEDYDAYTV